MRGPRRRLLVALGGLAAAHALPLRAQAKPARIGVLAFRSRPASFDSDLTYGAFVRALRDLGYVEGRNISIEWRFADSRYERFPELAQDLVKAKVELIVTHTTPGVRAVQAASRAIPIVSASMGDPVASGFTKSLARPDQNLTGLANVGFDATVKQLELLRIAVPGVARVGYLFNPQNPNIGRARQHLEGSASAQGVTVVSLDAGTSADIERAFAGLGAKRLGGLIVSNESFYIERITQIVGLEHRHRVPTVYSYTEFVRSGGLMSYGETASQTWARVAYYVDRLLKGAKPADLPIEQLATLRLAVNRQTARTLGITLPQELLLRADEVIQ